MSAVKLTPASASEDTFTVPLTVAYFSMEIALDPAMPTYSVGLIALTNDTPRACADLPAPMIAVTLLHRQGYLSQTSPYAKPEK